MTADLRTGTAEQATQGRTSALLWVLAAASVMSHIAIIVFHLPQAVGGAMIASSLTLFGLLHGASSYGWRGILFFLVVCLGVISGRSQGNFSSALAYDGSVSSLQPATNTNGDQVSTLGRASMHRASAPCVSMNSVA